MNKSLKYILIFLFFSFIFNSGVPGPKQQLFIPHPTSSILHPLITCFISPSNLNAYPEGWSDDIMVNEDTVRHQSSPDIDTDSQNNVWITWASVSFMDGEICYSKRDSVGNCIIPETNISNNPSHSGLAQVVVDPSDNVHFVWRDASPQGRGLWYARLANHGSGIVPSHLAVSGAGVLAVYTEIGLNKYQDINIVWGETPSGYDQISYTKLDSLGNPVIEKIRVSPEGLYAYWGGIGVDSFANNHLVYRTDSSGTGSRLTYSKLDKDGNILISNKVLAHGGKSAIVSDQIQNIHIAYSNPTGTDIKIDYLKLDQSGNILVGPKTISPPEIEYNTYAAMVIDSLQFLHVVWQGDQSSIFHIMYCKLDTLGNYVIPPMKIVYPPYTYGAGEPRIAVDHSNRLHVVWMDNRLGKLNIFYKRGENETGVKECSKLKVVGQNKITVSPNPFSTKTVIEFRDSEVQEFNFQLPNSSTPQLTIYDVSGREVRHFLLFPFNFSLSRTVEWDGTDNFGNPVPAGVYFLQFSNTENDYSIPIILLR